MSTTLRVVVAGLVITAVGAMPDTAGAQQAGPTAVAANAGLHAQASASRQAALNASNSNEAADLGLLIGGGAAFIVGVVVGGTGGLILALAGGILAVVGLVLFLT